MACTFDGAMLTFAVMFISLYNKPDWYKEVVPTKLVPAVSIRGRVVWESVDILKAGTQSRCHVVPLVQTSRPTACYRAISCILSGSYLLPLQALDEEFPERPLYPADPALAEEGEALSKLSDELSAAGYR